MNSIRQFKALSVVANVDTGPINKKLILENDSLKKKLEVMKEEYEKIMLMQMIGDRIEYKTLVSYWCDDCGDPHLEDVPDESWLDYAEDGYLTVSFRKDNVPPHIHWDLFNFKSQLRKFGDAEEWVSRCPNCELLTWDDAIVTSDSD